MYIILDYMCPETLSYFIINKHLYLVHLKFVRVPVLEILSSLPIKMGHTRLC